jgi:hypothetical protein
VYGRRQTVTLQLSLAATPHSRVEQIMTLAGHLARSGAVGDIDLVVLVAEAWVSPARVPFLRPSQDNNRCEVLVITALDGQTKAHHLQLFACSRARNGVVTALHPVPVPATVTVEVPLLRAFLTGYRVVYRFVHSSGPADALARAA